MAPPTVSVLDLEGLATEALAAAGIPQHDATAIAHVLVSADLFGIHTHGVQRIPQYVDRIRLGGINPTPSITMSQTAPAIAMLDGDNAVGPLIGHTALEAAMNAARTTGVGVVFARHSNHFGPVMPYLYDAAIAGYASIIASNATTTIAPTGGRQTKIGNNPLGWGAPGGDGDPFLLDIALSVVARAKIRAAAASDEPIPDTWATDESGRPTTDPGEALRGFLQPIAGHKGYGLSVMVDIFTGVLSGASYLDRVSSWSVNPERPQDLGQLFVLIDTGALGDDTGVRAEDFRERLLATTPADPSQPVRFPGQAEMRERRRQLRDGIALDEATLSALRELSA